MASRYEVFDNEEVQLTTRKQVAALGAFAAAAAGSTAAGLAAGHVGLVPMPAALGVLVLVWLGVIRYSTRRLGRLRRVMWCVKLSDRRVVGYDYARRRITLDWLDVRRVALTRHGLVLVGPGRRGIEVPALFPDYAALAHQVVRHAEFYDVPVFVDGRPWEALDVYAQFPELGGAALRK